MKSVCLVVAVFLLAGAAPAECARPDAKSHRIAETTVHRLMAKAVIMHNRTTEAARAVHSINQLVRACPVLTKRRESSAVLYAIAESVHKASRKYGIDKSLLYAMIVVESRCKHRARSRAGAMGLMQLMPRTARWLGVRRPYAIKDNIYGGSKYIAYLLRKYSGNTKLALAAYNSGPKAVKRHRGIPPFRETRRYVKKVVRYSRLFASTGRVAGV